jgi:hypothetical protein
MDKVCWYCGSTTDLRPRKHKSYECGACYRERVEAEAMTDMAFADDECDVASELGLRHVADR